MSSGDVASAGAVMAPTATATDAYTDDRLTIMALLADVHAGMAALIQPHLRQHGLTETAFEVLIRLARSEERRLRMSDLAAQTGMSTSGITRVVDRLEADGLVGRESCASDRRGLWAALRPAGQERIDSVLPGHLCLIEERLTGRLTAEELACVTHALRQIKAEVRRDTGVVPAEPPASGP